MELLRALAVMLEPPGAATPRIAALLDLPGPPDPADHTELFVFQLPPYASLYAGAEGMLGGEARDRVAGFWRALGFTPPPEPDHLAALLGLYASLAERQAEEDDAARAALRGQARSALLREHIACWVFAYLDRLSDIAPPHYRAWGALLARTLAAELEACAADGVGDDDALPVHLREAPPFAGPDAALDELIAALLAPVRSGFILTRADLARAARELGLGARVGERRVMLRALLSQDAAATLGWLAREAAALAARHRAREPELRGVARFWAERAEAAAAVLERCAAAAAAPRAAAGAARP